MKILFVYTVSESLAPPHKPTAEFIEISFSIAYLSAAVRRAGHEPSLVVLRASRRSERVGARAVRAPAGCREEIALAPALGLAGMRGRASLPTRGRVLRHAASMKGLR
jgi:hypothetical protein